MRARLGPRARNRSRHASQPSFAARRRGTQSQTREPKSWSMRPLPTNPLTPHCPQSREHHRPSPPSPSPLRPTADVNPGARARGRKPLASVRWEIEVAPVSHTLLNAAPTGSGALDWLGLATTAPSLHLCGGWSAGAGCEKDRQAYPN
jgi:hypothetical protein